MRDADLKTRIHTWRHWSARLALEGFALLVAYYGTPFLLYSDISPLAGIVHGVAGLIGFVEYWAVSRRVDAEGDAIVAELRER